MTDNRRYDSPTGHSDSTRTPEARATAIHRRTIRTTYAANGGRF